MVTPYQSTRGSLSDLSETFIQKLVSQTELWKQDKNCISCQKPLNLLNKKYFCKFCYRGVCSDCSQQKVFDHTVKQSVRTCKTCFIKFLRRYSVRQSRVSSVHSQNQIEKIFQQQRDTQRMREQFQIKIEKLQQKLEQLNWKEKEKQKELDQISQKIFSVQTILKREEEILVAQKEDQDINQRERLSLMERKREENEKFQEMRRIKKEKQEQNKNIEEEIEDMMEIMEKRFQQNQGLKKSLEKQLEEEEKIKRAVASALHQGKKK